MILARKNLVKQFVCSYAGQAEYKIDGKTYEVRYFAINHKHMAYNTGVLEHDIIPAVGTVRNGGYPSNFHEFPPREVVSLFPGFVGARWPKDFSALEYDGPVPVQMPSKYCSYYITAVGIEED